MTTNDKVENMLSAYKSKGYMDYRKELQSLDSFDSIKFYDGRPYIVASREGKQVALFLPRYAAINDRIEVLKVERNDVLSKCTFLRTKILYGEGEDIDNKDRYKILVDRMKALDTEIEALKSFKRFKVDTHISQGSSIKEQVNELLSNINNVSDYTKYIDILRNIEQRQKEYMDSKHDHGELLQSNYFIEQSVKVGDINLQMRPKQKEKVSKVVNKKKKGDDKDAPEKPKRIPKKQKGGALFSIVKSKVKSHILNALKI